MSHMVRTFIAGLIVVLPIVLTIALVVWIGNLVYEFVGPNSIVGRLLSAIGFGITASSAAAYAIGIAIVVACVYVLGLFVETRLQQRVNGIVNAVMRRIPLIRNVYDLARRFVALLDRKGGNDLTSMRPVWCFFGGDGGAAVLALLPTPDPMMHRGRALSGNSGSVGAGAVRRLPDLRSDQVDQAGRDRHRRVDDHLRVDGRIRPARGAVMVANRGTSRPALEGDPRHAVRRCRRIGRRRHGERPHSVPRRARWSCGCSGRPAPARQRSSRRSPATRAPRSGRGSSPARGRRRSTTCRPRPRCCGFSIRAGSARRATIPPATSPGARSSRTSCWS